MCEGCKIISKLSRDTKKSRIAFFAEGITLTHAVRPAILAKWAAESGYQVFLATGDNYKEFIEHEIAGTGVSLVPIRTQPAGDFLERLYRGLSVLDVPDLISAIEEDLRVLPEIAPDLVVGDMHLSLGISARLCKLPYALWLDPGLSRCTQQEYIVPNHYILGKFGTKLAQRIFNAIRPLAFYEQSKPYNYVRKRYGLKPITPHLFDVYADADYVLYPDIEEFNPPQNLPSHHHYIGPIIWSPKIPEPTWWHKLRKDVPIVYVNLGSSGPARLLPQIITAVAELPVQVIAGTAGRKVEMGQLPGNVFLGEFLPADQCMAAASVVINSGSPTAFYHAFKVSEAPILGIPEHMASHLGMQILTRAGAGVIMLPAEISSERIKATVASMLKDTKMKEAVRTMKEKVRQTDSKRKFLEFLSGALGNGRLS